MLKPIDKRTLADKNWSTQQLKYTELKSSIIKNICRITEKSIKIKETINNRTRILPRVSTVSVKTFYIKSKAIGIHHTIK